MHPILPLVGYVRLDGEFRIFALFCWILAASIELNKFIESGFAAIRLLRWIFVGLASFLLMSVVTGVIEMLNSRTGLFFNSLQRAGNSSLTDFFKSVIDSIEFHDALILQGLLQLCFLFILWIGVKKKSVRWLYLCVFADLTLATLLNVPFTGVGKGKCSLFSKD
jgi:hypothetical protein